MGTKIAVITGGSRGIGRSTVEHLARLGINSIFTYNSSSADADSVVASVEEAGATAIALQLDTGAASSFGDVTTRLSEALAQMGAERFDYLVNNAGISSHTPFDELTEQELDQLWSVNVKGVLLLTQHLLPLINDGGSIVNLSSGVVRFVNKNSTGYAITKGAIDVFSRYLAFDLGPRNINVNSVAPGATMTDFSGGSVRDNPAVNKAIADLTAMGRAGHPDDIGGMIASFLDGDNQWVTAQRIEVSGGLHL